MMSLLMILSEHKMIKPYTLSYILDLILICIFVMCNWMMDISSWIHQDRCATNGFVVNCSNVLTYHIFWYLSIVIALYFMIRLVLFKSSRIII